MQHLRWQQIIQLVICTSSKARYTADQALADAWLAEYARKVVYTVGGAIFVAGINGQR